jgi:hypothetical protein
MARDAYKGIPKKVKLYSDQDGNIMGNTKLSFTPFVTGSGTLVDGYLRIDHNDIGHHTIALITPMSGTSAPAYTVDATNHYLHVSSSTAGGKFSYMLLNPGIGSRKIS